jgi:hypothetical protein
MLRGIYLDMETSTIQITREYARNLKIHNSPEARTLLQYRNLYPTFSVKRKTVSSRKVSYNGLTLQYMKRHILDQADGQVALIEFEAIVRKERGQPGFYSHVKSWFLKKYPEYTAMVRAIKAEEIRIAKETAKKQAEAEKQAKAHADFFKEQTAYLSKQIPPFGFPMPTDPAANPPAAVKTDTELDEAS